MLTFQASNHLKKKKSILIFHVRNALSKHFCKHQKKKIQTVPLPDPGAYIVLKKKKITKMDDIVRLA